MELLRIEQAQEFKAICTPEQMEKFEILVKEIGDFFKADNPQARNNENRPQKNNENQRSRKNENQRPRKNGNQNPQ
jgi:hypothetical protein